MPEVDYVLKDIKVVEKDTDIDFKKLYKFLGKVFSDNGYFVFEKEYMHHLKEDLRNKSIKWKGYKKVDDYSRFWIEVRIKLSNANELEGNDEMLYHGDISFNFESYIQKDYYSKWEFNSLMKLLRAVWDKFFLGIKFTQYETQLKDETYDIFNKTKTYLGGW